MKLHYFVLKVLKIFPFQYGDTPLHNPPTSTYVNTFGVQAPPPFYF